MHYPTQPSTLRPLLTCFVLTLATLAGFSPLFSPAQNASTTAASPAATTSTIQGRIVHPATQEYAHKFNAAGPTEGPRKAERWASALITDEALAAHHSPASALPSRYSESNPPRSSPTTSANSP